MRRPCARGDNAKAAPRQPMGNDGAEGERSCNGMLLSNKSVRTKESVARCSCLYHCEEMVWST